MTTLPRYLRTLRYVEPSQLGWRVVHEARLRLYARAGAWPARVLRDDDDARIALPSSASLPSAALAVERLIAERWRAGRVEHIGIEADGRDWHAAALPKLWRYEHQYHAELVSLAALSAAEPSGGWLDDARELLRSWRAACPPARGDAWEPYPVSRRIINWTLAALVAPSLRPELAPSLSTHVRFLGHHFERHLRGNHLLTNALAVVIGGMALEAPPAAPLRLARSVLEAELRRQVLADGGYSERAAQYHATVLHDLLLAVFVAGWRSVRSPVLTNVAARMARWLADVVRPDGSLPPLNDSAPNPRLTAEDVLGMSVAIGALSGDWGGWRRIALGGSPSRSTSAPAVSGDLLLPATGWTIVRSGRSELLFEHGPIGPADQPGHGHADALSFELVWKGAPVVADSGVTTYDRGPVRDYERSAAAHACVTVDDDGADEVWSSFRVGGRATVSATPLVRRAELRLVAGEVHAWTGWRHRRTLAFLPDVALVVFDEVLDAAPTAALRTHLPLAPGVVVDGSTLAFADQSLRLVARGTGAPERVIGSVSAGFGRRVARTVLVWPFDVTRTAAYALVAHDVAGIEWTADGCTVRHRGVATHISRSLV